MCARPRWRASWRRPPTPEMNHRVARNLLVLPRLLRRAGVAVDPERARLCLRALAELDLERRGDVRAACRSSLVSRQADLAPFEETFDLFWSLLRGAALPQEEGGVAARGRDAEPPADAPLAPLPRTMAPQVTRTVRVVASPVELLRRIDFAA